MLALEFDSIVVLESLPGHHRKTGKVLYDRVLKPHADAHPNLIVHYNPISGREHLLKAFEVIEGQMIDKGHRPIIHIEAHGDQEEMLLADGSTISWAEIREILTRLNIKTRFNLLLVMAMCEGWWLSQVLIPFQPAPVWGVLGPTKPVLDSELLRVMTVFYTQLFSNSDVLPALEEANQHLPIEDWTYLLTPAEMLFCMAFRRYMEDATAENLQARENEIVAAFTRGKGNFDVRAAMEARVYAHDMLQNKHREFFEYCRRRYFLLDDLPENAGRVRASYDWCVDGKE